jgi:hypothetical protein
VRIFRAWQCSWKPQFERLSRQPRRSATEHDPSADFELTSRPHTDARFPVNDMMELDSLQAAAEMVGRYR